MAQRYRTSEGDTVDLIVWNYYGTQAGQMVEQVLEANPGLSDQGAKLPAGLVVVLPDLKQVGQSEGVKLWD